MNPSDPMNVSMNGAGAANGDGAPVSAASIWLRELWGHDDQAERDLGKPVKALEVWCGGYAAVCSV